MVFNIPLTGKDPTTGLAKVPDEFYWKVVRFGFSDRHPYEIKLYRKHPWYRKDKHIYGYNTLTNAEDLCRDSLAALEKGNEVQASLSRKVTGKYPPRAVE